ncbi:hypothetical protein AVEN_229319-1 [Araneus ventricosus]|uniref:CCHC-type domain-containing protein n=1 Tax=Araneus ventricosus TaxID=182803 RepID=A0A4Y2T9M8_ARAVE|nr:hypothetical protein AVEN_229319-1 [Araneus ventricosus]
MNSQQMSDSNSDVELLNEVTDSDIQAKTSAPRTQEMEDSHEPNFEDLHLDEEISELVVLPAQRRRRSSSTSSVSSVVSSSQGIATKIFDDRTPLEDLLTTLRKIVNSTTTPSNLKTKPKPRLTITLQQFANSILDCLEERREAFEASKTSAQNTGKANGPPVAHSESATQTEHPETSKDSKEVQTDLMHQGLPTEPKPVAGQRSTQEGSKEQSLRKLLQKEVNPLEEHFNIQEVRNIRNKGLAIGIASEAQADRLISKLANKEGLQSTVEARKYSKTQPRCIIYDVPVATKEEDLKAAIELATGCEAENISLSFRTRERNVRSHCVIQTTPLAFAALLSLRKLSLGWTRHSVKEHLNIKRCFKCQSYGHLQRECKRKNYYCAFCGFEHHTNSCNSRAPCCANCWEENTRRRAGFRVDHPADATCCPVYQREVLKYKRTVQYS